MRLAKPALRKRVDDFARNGQVLAGPFRCKTGDIIATGGIGGHSSANVTHHLKGMRFPASKDDILMRARDKGAGQDVLEVLEDEEFNTLADVMKAYGQSD